MHKFRTHNCNELRKEHLNQEIKLSGWVHRKRDHGNLLFIDLRDHHGITQCVFNPEEIKPELLDKATNTRYESVVTIVGKVVARNAEAVNNNLDTGEIEVLVKDFHVESAAEMLPLLINQEQEFPEETRLKYRFLDLRRESIHNNIVLRSKIISYIRNIMTEKGFLEIQTPILTSSSPEGARDFLVPSRLHPGKFYALPQAPQQFKQLLMVAGFDKYFQIAPCFRDEDARADRSPGEFYQLDLEMSFVTQDDVFTTMEPVLYDLFCKFSDKKVSEPPFIRIDYDDAMLKYGCDKPDLRNPIEMVDLTEFFTDSNFEAFKAAVANGSVVRGIPVPGCAKQPRSYFDKLAAYSTEKGAKGLGYISLNEDGTFKGPIAKFLDDNKLQELAEVTKLNKGDVVFFVCDKEKFVNEFSSNLRLKLGEDLGIVEKDTFKFCWIVNFPFFELDDKTNKIQFSHNPFSMPQGGMEILEKAKTTEELLAIKAFQYDIVCNGVELSSGAIRNHKPEIMYKAFEICGYSKEEVDEKFGAMINAFKFGAPPHGGFAPGIDRMVMLLADEPNIREIIAFPMNQQAQDLMMNAPATVKEDQLKELNIQLSPTALKKLKSIE